MSGEGVISRVASRVRKILKRGEDQRLRHSLEQLIEQHAEETKEAGEEPGPALDPHERVLIGNVLRLRGVTADDVMVPRTDIIAVPETLTLDELARAFQREGHSRLPVYRETLDEIVGMVHMRDVFAAIGRNGPFAIPDILLKPLFVPPSKPCLDLLLEMRQHRMHMALVVDEYGGIDGLVTIEDIVEEIVGDIADEHDEPIAPMVIERSDGTLDIDARLTVQEFEARLGRVLTEDEREGGIETVGGLVLGLARRVPARGETIAHPSGTSFKVLEADSRRLRKLRVTPILSGSEATAA